MKIDVEKWVIREQVEKTLEIISYRLISTKPCCGKILKFPNLNLVYEFPEDEDDLSDSEDECKVLGMMLCEKDKSFDGEDYWDETKYHLITHCPRCGELIEINIVRELDKSEEYYNLKFEYDSIHKEWMNCDSIRKSSELEKQWRTIDAKLNGFYNTDTLKC